MENSWQNRARRDPHEEIKVFRKPDRHPPERNRSRSVVDDQVGNPTWARALAEMIGRLLAKAGDAPFAFFEKNAGVYHLAGRGYVSRFELAKEIIALASIREPGLVSSIQPARTADFPAPAQRPLFSALDCAHFETIFDLRLPEWQDALALAMHEV
ncbi:MAG: sugar nucleotide-binding protein [bacterium]|nr:sugar nucleotide-binding protein [bacterium]